MYVERTDSTNSLLLNLIADGNPPKYIRAGYQTSGRGQAGNGWESEKDKNLLCSIPLPPDEEPFFLNVAVSVALHRVVSQVIRLTTLEADADKKLFIKWPNDLYYDNKKLGGILLETAMSGSEVKYAIAGIGLNVNQTEWHSDAPNPISLKTICETITGGKASLDVEDFMDDVYLELQHVFTEPRDLTWRYYKWKLYRSQGLWPYVERAVNTSPTMNAGIEEQGQFKAEIADVLPTGELVLRDENGTERKYHFKQIRYVIS